MNHIEQYRNLLFSIAYKIIGEVTEAEDIVQDVLVKYSSGARTNIKNEKQYLVKAATNASINRYHQLRKSREEYKGPWLPEPVVTSPQQQKTPAKDELRLSWLKLLEHLNPYERAVWVLRQAFDYDYEAIAEFTGKSEDNCRQLYKRATDQLEKYEVPGKHSIYQQESYLRAFLHAVESGDLSDLKELFHKDITLYSDGGGKVAAALKPLVSDDIVARFIDGIRSQSQQYSYYNAQLNGQPGIVVYNGNQLDSVLTIEADEKGIETIYIIRNPDKLGNVEKIPNRLSQKE